jgi:hypothetical protein
MSRIVAIWCSGVGEVTRHSNQLKIAHRLVSVLPDTEMKHACWALFCLDEAQYERVTAIPRLTWR